MVRFPPQLAVLALFFPAALARAANDWAQPCHYGECNWDLSSESRSAAVRVVSACYPVFTKSATRANAVDGGIQTGSRSGISDLTDAAGWTVLDCDASTPVQDIRVVCHDPELGCDHLYENGAEQTLVRLPDEVRLSVLQPFRENGCSSFACAVRVYTVRVGHARVAS